MSQNVSRPKTQANSQADRAIQYFEKIEDDVDNNNYYRCIIGECRKILNGKKTANLVCHIRVCHKDIYGKKIAPKQSQHYYLYNRLKFVQNCVEMVTINGRPFNSLLDSGFQKCVEEELKELRENGFGINIGDTGFSEIQNYVENVANKIRNKIKAETKTTFVSLMVDIAKKNNVSFLGVSMQFAVDSAIRVRSLGMMQLKESNTAQYIKEVISNCLAHFDIELDQVTSITTDNGSNMLAMIDLFNKEMDVDGNDNEIECMSGAYSLRNENDILSVTAENVSTN